MDLKISKPSTVYIDFNGACPDYFCLYDSNDDVYYFRFLDGNTPSMKFNVVQSDTYHGNIDFNIVKVNGIETPGSYPALPPAERDRWKNCDIVFNPELEGTPARIFSQPGIIEVGQDWVDLPKPMRLFLLLHEKGHLLYKTESYCDLWAFVNYLRMGYNRSMAFYALYFILGRSTEAVNRISFILFNIKDCTGEFDPGV